MKYRIWHNRPECIACGACAAVTENFYMDEVDTLASVKNDVIDEADKELNEEAAMVCPVNIIHVAPEGEIPNYFQELGITEPPNGRRDDE
jgi:ferredoxin